VGEPQLVVALQAGQVLGHPFVLGEIALGQLRQRAAVLDALAALPQAARATDAEVLALIDQAGLSGSGLGYIDAHLLAAARLTPGASLCTRDRRLRAAAVASGIFTAL
jgi:predicted nucleic acid-binding protein